MPSARAQRSEPKASEPPAGALKREATAKAAETPMPAKVHTSSPVTLPTRPPMPPKTAPAVQSCALRRLTRPMSAMRSGRATPGTKKE